MGKSSTGLRENTAGLLCYVGGWISGIVFLMLEKESRSVKFHAMQSIVVFGILTVAQALLNWLPVIGGVLGYIIGMVALVAWIVLMIGAYQGKMLKVPWAGEFAEKQIR